MKRIIAVLTASSLWVNVLTMASLAPATLTMTACTLSDAQIAADGAAVAQACLSIAADPAIPAGIAQKLTTAAQALAAATANWQTGNPTAIIASLAAGVEVILAAIPVTAPFAMLVPIAVAAIEILISNIHTANPQLMAARAPIPDVYAHAVIHHRLGRSPEGDFKAAWNELIEKHRELARAKL